jgi:hypothetical protein
MDKQQLHRTLEQLHGELQKIVSVDESERPILQQLMGDIQKLVDGQEGDQHRDYDRLGEGLREGIELLEASHPGLTMLMGQIVDALGKIGI